MVTENSVLLCYTWIKLGTFSIVMVHLDRMTKKSEILESQVHHKTQTRKRSILVF